MKNWGGHFTPELGGQFAPEMVVNLDWKVVVNITGICNRPQAFTSEANRMEFLFEHYEKYTAVLFSKEKLKKLKK
jgi:hypothetical protein